LLHPPYTRGPPRYYEARAFAEDRLESLGEAAELAAAAAARREAARRRAAAAAEGPSQDEGGAQRGEPQQQQQQEQQQNAQEMQPRDGAHRAPEEPGAMVPSLFVLAAEAVQGLWSPRELLAMGFPQQLLEHMYGVFGKVGGC
jgi:hypothetical protein